jgi:hypothetical protein
MQRYPEVEKKKTLEFFKVDSILVVGGQVIQQSIGIAMETNCTSVLADLFLYSYEMEFIQKLLHEKKYFP